MYVTMCLSIYLYLYYLYLYLYVYIYVYVSWQPKRYWYWSYAYTKSHLRSFFRHHLGGQLWQLWFLAIRTFFKFLTTCGRSSKQVIPSHASWKIAHPERAYNQNHIGHQDGIGKRKNTVRVIGRWYAMIWCVYIYILYDMVYIICIYIYMIYAMVSWCTYIYIYIYEIWDMRYDMIWYDMIWYRKDIEKI